MDRPKEHDLRRLEQLCARLQAGEIVLFDKGYYVFDYFCSLTLRGVHFVTRAKDKLGYRMVKRLPNSKDPRILRDELIMLKTPQSKADYIGRLRLGTALVELDGEQRVMVFLANNLEWSPASVAGLYRCRWQIEVFFKQIKQPLQLADFRGNNANAVKWQLWMAVLLYVLLRFQAWRGCWTHSLSRLLTLQRPAQPPNLALSFPRSSVFLLGENRALPSCPPHPVVGLLIFLC